MTNYTSFLKAHKVPAPFSLQTDGEILFVCSDEDGRLGRRKHSSL